MTRITKRPDKYHMAEAKDISLGYINGMTSRYKTGIRIFIFLVIAALLTWVILKFVRAFKKPANASYVEGGGAIPDNWDPEQMTKKLFDIIDGTLVTVDTFQEGFGDFNKLSDNQMIAVYNQWTKDGFDKEKKYYMFPYGTLTNAIKDKVGYVQFSGQNQKDLAEANLDRLKLP